MYDRVLVGPSALDLTAALAEAGGGQRSSWEKRIATLRERREGRRYWSKLKVGIAWWTDHQGRRHFRVAGGDNPFWSGKLPALADLYPDVWIRRGLGAGEPALVLLCGCGAVHPVASTDWAGPRCAACERLAEQGVTPPSQTTILDLGLGVWAVEWSAGFVVVQPDQSGIRVCDRTGTTLRELAKVHVDAGWAAVVSPDDRFLITVSKKGRLRVYELQGGAIVTEQSVGQADSIWFSPLGSTVAMTHAYEVRLYDHDAEIGALHLKPHDPWTYDLAWSAQGRRACLGKRGVEVFDESDEPMEVEDPKKAHPLPRTPGTTPVRTAVSELGQLRFTADGNGLRGIWTAPMSDSWRYTAVARWDWDGSRWERRPDVPLPCADLAQISPDGRWVGNGRGWLTMTDIETGETMGTIGWTGALTRFLADSRNILFVNAGRIRVVPWARLLGVPTSAGG